MYGLPGQLAIDVAHNTNTLSDYRTTLQDFAIFHPWKVTWHSVYMGQSWHFLNLPLQDI